MANIFYTFILRFCQAGLDASLTLVMGVIVAGIIHRMVGPAATRRLFGSGWGGPLRGWAAGMLLPVCSLGVIPVARELRRAGVPGGTVLAFVLTGPLLNPISFLYGLTLGEPKVIISFAAITLLKTAVVAYLWEAWFGGAADAAFAVERARVADAIPLPIAGAKRMVSVLVTAARELSGHDVIYYTIGLLGNAILSCLIPHGALQRTMSHLDHLAPLRMLFLSIPAYVSPLSGMMRIGSMFEHGNSIGAAFILLVLGIGMSLGTLTWLLHDFGRRIAPWFVLYTIIVLGIGYACEPLLWDSRKVEADHTHAFDDLSSPFYKNRETAAAQMADVVRSKLAQQFGMQEELALICLGSLLVSGIVLRIADQSGKLERWLLAPPAPGKAKQWDFSLSGVALGGTAITGLIVFSVVGAYVYYPNREFCLERMRGISADTRDMLRQNQVNESIRNLEQWDLVARQLQVGVYIRDFHVTHEQAKTVDDLREAIEVVRDDLRAGKIVEAKQKFDEIVFTGEYKACRDCYGPKTSQAREPQRGLSMLTLN
jgi:uncharacterized membrane protein YraQ (UPF0718 family)